MRLDKIVVTYLQLLTAMQQQHNTTQHNASMQCIAAELSESQIKAIVDRTALGRIGTEQEVAELITMVAASPYMTGSVVSIDGGLS
jgi:NAD(P)-dependent dehydrogenase (short-subunit alcohol dehydrogenase family)